MYKGQVSCDYNYRANLWKYGRKAPEVMRDLVKLVQVGIANEEDCQKSLGVASTSDATSGHLATDAYRALGERVLADVSFTHLTLPTIVPVLNSVGGADGKKKK